MADLGGSFGAVVLAGGRGSRLGGVDKAGIEVGGRTLLDVALDVVVDAAETVVVGDPVPVERPVTFVRESPRYGGPVAGLLTGVDALLRSTPTVVVIAVDMPRLSTATIRRVQQAAAGREGAVLVDPDDRAQPVLVLDRALLAARRPTLEEQHGMALRALLERFDLARVAAEHDEHRDVDTWGDLRDLGSDRGDDLGGA